MSNAAEPKPSRSPLPPAPFSRQSLNAPNLITISRFVLSIVLFALVDQGRWWRTAAVVFVVAALTDYLDGYLARKYGQVTVLGRILDPFVDKIIIIGAFVFLQRWPASGVTAWMTFIIIARELLITSLRAFLEQQGKDFSAKWSGKIKMVVQCAAVPLCLLSLSEPFLASLPDWLPADRFLMLRDVALWGTVAITVYSGVEYVWRAFRMLAD